MGALADDLRERIRSVEQHIWIRKQGSSISTKFIVSLGLGVLVSVFAPKMNIVSTASVVGYWVWLAIDANRDRELQAELASLQDQLDGVEEDD